MNLEDLKKSLLEMISEANNLEDSELVDIPEINIKVKRGRKEEFLNVAKLYYEMTNQVILTKEDALEYIKQVYSEISSEILKEDFEKLDHLKKDLETNMNMQKKYQKIEDSLKIKAAVEPGSWETIRDTQDLLKDLKDTEQKTRNSIADIKNRVNNVVKKVIETEMEHLRAKYKEQKTRNHTAGLDGAYILNEDKEAYDNLYLLLRVIENASENLPLINIDDTLLVNPHQEATARLLLPGIKQLKREEITQVKPKLLDLNTELKEHIAIELTKLIKNAKDHPEEALAEGKEVLVNDLEKYNLLANQFEILTMIYDTDELVTVGKAEIPKEKEDEYKDICNKLENLKQNEVIIEKLRSEINDIVASKGLNKTELEKFNLLARQIEILNSVDKNAKLKEVEGALINEALVDEYTDNLNKINSLRNKKEIVPLEANEPLIKETEAQISELLSRGEIEENKEKFDLLNQKLEILKGVKPTDSVVSIDRANISILKMDEYINISQKLNDIQKETTPSISSEEPELLEPPKEPLKRRAVKMVRKVTKKEWWKKNWKKVAGVGLSLTVVAFTLTTLAPTLIYLNSCLAMALPGAAGTLGSINNVLATIGGVTMNSLNFNVAASNLLGALGTSAVKLGLIGGGALASYKIFKHTDENRLPEPKEKESAIAKIKELGNELIGRTKELTENLAYAVDGPNINQNQYMNDQLGKNTAVENLEEEQKFQEIEENVQNAINQEEEEMERRSEEEINRRFKQIQNDMNEAVTSPVATPEELKEETEEDTLSSDIIDLTPKASPSTAIPLPEQMPITIPSEEELNRLLSEGLEANEESLGRGR